MSGRARRAWDDMVKVKVCGVTRGADAVLAAELGAWAVGFVFWEPSPRSVDPTAAAEIVAALPPEVMPVGVFVDPTKDWVCEVAEHVHLATIQLHGQETVAFCHDLPYPVIKAVPLRTTADIEAATGLPDDISVLLDATDPVSKGGTGRTIDWTMAAAAARTREVWLAGGLGPENVVEAVETVGPYGVDVSSGLETAPGVKDTGKMRAFFEALEQTWATQSRA